MKKLEKAWIFIDAVLILLLAFVAVNGIHLQYGDTVRTLVRGVGDLERGSDLGGGLELILEPADGLSPSPMDLQSTSEVLQRRLDYLETSGSAEVDQDQGRFIIRLPQQSSGSYAEIVQVLTDRSALTLRDGIGTDENGAPTGEILLEEKDVLSATAAGDTETGAVTVELNLTEDGQNKFDSAASRLAGAGRNISVWIDGQLISVIYTREEEVLPVLTGEWTAADARLLADRINARALPLDLTAENFSLFSPLQGQRTLETLLLAAKLGLLFLAVILLALYRLPGAVAVLALLGQAALMLAAYTGFFPFLPAQPLTTAGVLGGILALGFGANTMAGVAERLKADLNSGKNLDFAVGHCFRHSYTTLFDGRMALVILLILVLAAVDLAAEGLGWLAPVQAFTNLFRIKEAAVSLHAFFFAVLSGVVANYLMCGRIARSMLRSLSKYPLLRDPVFYGGTRHA